jgi:hypothetical protein
LLRPEDRVDLPYEKRKRAVGQLLLDSNLKDKDFSENLRKAFVELLADCPSNDSETSGGSEKYANVRNLLSFVKGRLMTFKDFWKSDTGVSMDYKQGVLSDILSSIILIDNILRIFSISDKKLDVDKNIDLAMPVDIKVRFEPFEGLKKNSKNDLLQNYLDLFAPVSPEMLDEFGFGVVDDFRELSFYTKVRFLIGGPPAGLPDGKTAKEPKNKDYEKLLQLSEFSEVDSWLESKLESTNQLFIKEKFLGSVRDPTNPSQKIQNKTLLIKNQDPMNRITEKNMLKYNPLYHSENQTLRTTNS